MFSKKKIAFVIQGLGVGGAEKFLVNIINFFYFNNFEPYLIILGCNNELIHEINSNIKIIYLLKKNKYDFFICYKIKRYLLNNNIHNIFCINSYSFFLTKLFFVFDRSVKFFVSLHSTIPFSKKYFFQNLLYFRFISKDDIIIYLCNNQKKYLKNKYFISTNNEFIIYNGIDVTYFNPNIFSHLNKNLIKKSLNIKDDHKIIILVARLQSEKRHIDAINALHVLHNKFFNKAHLLFVGSGNLDYANFLNDQVQKLKLSNFIHFVGNKLDVRQYYSISDIFTLTSNSETFSLAALEAMSFGLPCSLTNIGGASEMIIEGISGTLSEKENIYSIAYSWNLLLNSNLDKFTIRNKVLDKFSSQRMFKQYLHLINTHFIQNTSF